MKKNLLNGLKKEMMARFDDAVIKNIGSLINLELNKGLLNQDNFMELVGLLNKENVEMIKPAKLNMFYLDKSTHIYGNVNYYFEYNNETDGSEKKQMLFDEFIHSMNLNKEDLINDENEINAVKKNFDKFLNDLKSINNVYQMINDLKKNEEV